MNSPSIGKSARRAALSAVLIGLWLVAFLAGLTGGGLLHLFLLASLAIFPWRWLRAA